MRRLIILPLWLWLFAILPTQAQNIVAGEYFIDTDPGLGSGTAMPAFTPSANVSQQLAVNLNGVGSGFHYLFTRFKNQNGVWGMYEGRLFYVAPLGSLSASNIAAGEYFIDTDPGVGNGTPMPSFGASATVNTALAINLSGVQPGFHYLFTRFKNSAGIWGHYEGRMFYVAPLGSLGSSNIVAGEYFIDNDPGLGNGTAMPTFVASASVNPSVAVNLAGVQPGFHYLFTRFKNQNGVWGHYEGRMFYVAPIGALTASNIVAGEYFIDNDPGLGNGTALPAFAPNDTVNPVLGIDLTGIASGVHRLYIRFKDASGKWGIYEGRQFEVCGSLIAGQATIVPSVGGAEFCATQLPTFTANVVNGGTGPVYQWLLNGSEVTDQSSYSPNSLEDGDRLILNVTSSLSCVSPSPMRDTLDVSIIEAVYSTEQVTICQGESYQLPDGNTVSAQGDYDSYLVATNGCDSIVTTELTVEICVGVQQAAGDFFRIHPNPTDGPLTLQFGTEAQRSLMVMDATGREVLRTTISATTATLSLDGLSSGMYVLRVAEGSSMQHVRVVKR